ncbi:MAG: hypothetical protein C0481_15450 [Phenylobacterium sp.]|uniref:DUF6118 family protein n=1 Tax=Phenylobacterium sp. TaxID=1871053 RepID=UPI0025E3754C|nr:DUF6118 family protein [Phenylobacterium sp.]MBA4013260.1 hypothetical protein [Phenylobacterium sp.]
MNEDAEEAFDSLRGEVALLRRAIEGFMADPVKIPPEVSRQMRAQSAELARLAEETQRLAGSPALDMTLEEHKRQIETLVGSIAEGARAPWNKTLADLRAVGAEFARYGERARDQDLQRQQLVYAAISGAVAALAAWVVLSGPIARALPAKWFIAERMAAATLDQDRWAAGQRLMGTANQEAWSTWLIAFDLYTLNDVALSRCARRNSAGLIARRCEIELPRSMS